MAERYGRFPVQRIVAEGELKWKTNGLKWKQATGVRIPPSAANEIISVKERVMTELFAHVQIGSETIVIPLRESSDEWFFGSNIRRDGEEIWVEIHREKGGELFNYEKGSIDRESIAKLEKLSGGAHFQSAGSGLPAVHVCLKADTLVRT